MHPTSLPGRNGRPPCGTRARVSGSRNAAGGLFAAALLLTGLVAVPGTLDGQRVESSDDRHFTARVDVEAVVTVAPRGPVTVSFPTSSARTGPVEAPTATRLSCAGNTAHSVRVRLVSISGAAPADEAGELQWSGDGGDSWAPLEATARVVDGLTAGRHEGCATVHFRWASRDGGAAAPAPEQVTVDFEAEPLRERAPARR